MAMIKHRVFLKIQKTLAQNYQIVNIYYGVFEMKHFSIVFHVAHLKLANERNTSKRKKKKNHKLSSKPTRSSQMEDFLPFTLLYSVKHNNSNSLDILKNF